MTKTLTITLPDNLDQALMAQSQRLNQSPEAIVVEALIKQLTVLAQTNAGQVLETDPLLRLIGLLSVDSPDLAENHDRYIGQDLYQELKGDG